ncbi:MAG TPA: AAA family ATPase [Candidatus Acidoferrales bacterium]|jgi:general secretion pathway protein A|nr:AAA family ATPase [Candidatus Acidoferrales bacterium]
MFLEFYHLRQQPFGVTPDPAYLYLTRTHRDALNSLNVGIKEGRGFFSLIAEPGMGKTTLLYELLDQLHDSARTVFLFQTQCDSREFFQYLLSELGVDIKGMDLVSMHNKLNELLFAEMVAGRRFVLVVDEAQNLDDSVLETVRLLSNFETSYAKMLQIVLAGQPQLSSKLSQPKLAQLKQRLAVQAKLDPLSAAETANYIDHRLMVAGHTGAPLFTPDALAVIARLSGGTPRTVNHLCYSAMSAAHELGHETIHADVVETVAIKLGFSSAPAIAHVEKPIAREPAVAGVAARAATATSAASASTSPAPISQSTAAPAPAAPRRSVAESDPSNASAPSVAEAPVETAMRSAATQSGSGLTYEAPKKLRLPRWAHRAMVLAGILLLAGIFLTAFVLRFTESGQSSASRVVPAAAQPSSGSTPANTLPHPESPPKIRPSPSGNGEPGSGSYSADPQESGSEQIITVAVKPDQTLRDLSILYAGRYDNDILKQILALNPELKDPDHLEPGQLIRLPLPAGSFRKGKVFTPEE